MRILLSTPDSYNVATGVNVMEVRIVYQLSLNLLKKFVSTVAQVVVQK